MAKFTIKTPDELAAEDAAHHAKPAKQRQESAVRVATAGSPPRHGAAQPKPPQRAKPARQVEYSPFTMVQAVVVRALVPRGRLLVIQPPNSGRVIIPPRHELHVKYATFNRLNQLGALERLYTGTSVEQYVLSKTGQALWAEHCRIEGKPSYDPKID